MLVIRHHVTRLLSIDAGDDPDLRKGPGDSMPQLRLAVKRFAEEPRLDRIHRIVIPDADVIGARRRIRVGYRAAANWRFGLRVVNVHVRERRVRIRNRWILTL